MGTNVSKEKPVVIKADQNIVLLEKLPCPEDDDDEEVTQMIYYDSLIKAAEQHLKQVSESGQEENKNLPKKRKLSISSRSRSVSPKETGLKKVATNPKAEDRVPPGPLKYDVKLQNSLTIKPKSVAFVDAVIV